MKKILILVFLGMVSFEAHGKLKVLIDPGHGGEDHGTTHHNIKEKNLTLDVSLELYENLKSDTRFSPSLTRRGDGFLSLDSRAKKAEENKVDVFISIHANSSPISTAKGTEIYFESQNPTDEESLFLANRENNVKNYETVPSEKSDLKNILEDLNRSNHMNMSAELSQNILESLQKKLNIKTRAIRQAPFKVLRVTMPATLIELGFLTNEKEAQWLNLASTKKNMAEAIYKGLISYKEKLDKLNSKP